MLLSVGAILLLSFLILRVNSTQLHTEEEMVNSKFGLVAISIGTSVIEEANKKAFDENTFNAFCSSPNMLSNTMGPEKLEVDPNFNDFDDYNNLDRDISIPNDTNSVHIHCAVSYINPSQPDIDITTKTFNKKITVYVSSKYMADTIKISSIFCYWKKI